MTRTASKLAVTVGAGALIALAMLGTLDEAGRAYTAAGFKRALVTYGVARTLNGVISVAQGTELAFEPAGIGVTLTPGQILDPVNDLIERFSWIVLISGTSLGVQRVLLEATTAPALTAALAGVLALAVLLTWWPAAPAASAVVRRIAVLLVLARFAVPLLAVTGDALYATLLEPRFSASARELEASSAAVRELGDPAPAAAPGEERSLLESARRAYASAAEAVDVRRRLEQLERTAAAVTEHTVELIVVFVIETLLFPLAFLWLLAAAARRTLARDLPR